MSGLFDPGALGAKFTRTRGWMSLDRVSLRRSPQVWRAAGVSTITLTQIAIEAPAGAFATSVDTAPAAVLVASPEGRLLAANKLACGMLGWRRIELLSLGMSDVGLAPLVVSRVCAEADERGLSL